MNFPSTNLGHILQGRPLLCSLQSPSNLPEFRPPRCKLLKRFHFSSLWARGESIFNDGRPSDCCRHIRIRLSLSLTLTRAMKNSCGPILRLMHSRSGPAERLLSAKTRRRTPLIIFHARTALRSLSVFCRPHSLMRNPPSSRRPLLEALRAAAFYALRIIIFMI
jgi:hypothetical protein